MFGIDDVLLGGLISGGASLVGSFLSSDSQSNANQQNAALAADAANFNANQAELNRSFTAEQVQKQLDFQERMSGTSYQRAVHDLSQAGLNPMLAYSQGGASSPAGAAGAGSSASMTPARMEPTLPHGSVNLSSAVGAARTMAEIDLIQAQRRKVEAETTTETYRPGQVWQDTQKSEYETRNLNQRMHNLISDQRLTQAQEDKVRDEITVIKEEQGIAAANMMLKRFEMLLTEMEFPRAIAEAKAWSTAYGQDFRPYIGDIVKGIGSAAAARYGIQGPAGRGLRRP